VVQVPAKPRNADELLLELHKERKTLQQAAQIPRVLTIIDYFQLLNVVSAGQLLPEDDEVKLETLLRFQASTRTPTVTTGDPVVVLSEVRKGDGSRSRLTTNDLLGSSRLAYGAEAILLLEPEGASACSESDVAPVVLRVAKVRDGGQRGDIPLCFHHSISRFEERKITAKGGGKDRSRKDRRHPPADTINPLAGSEED
jgi:hypothetical protein